MYPIQDVRIANCKCQSPSSFIFNTEIRQPKEYLLVSNISNSDTRGERARKENLTYPSVGTPDHKEAFQRSLCMCKAPLSVRRSFFQSTCFFFFFLILKRSDSFYVRNYFTLLLYSSLIVQINWNRYLQITLPILSTPKLKHTRDCRSRTLWHVVWFEVFESKANQIGQKNSIIRIF